MFRPTQPIEGNLAENSIEACFLDRISDSATTKCQLRRLLRFGVRFWTCNRPLHLRPRVLQSPGRIMPDDLIHASVSRECRCPSAPIASRSVPRMSS